MNFYFYTMTYYDYQGEANKETGIMAAPSLAAAAAQIERWDFDAIEEVRFYQLGGEYQEGNEENTVWLTLEELHTNMKDYGIGFEDCSCGKSCGGDCANDR